MSKINWSVAILDAITIIIGGIGYMTSNNILPNYEIGRASCRERV